MNYQQAISKAKKSYENTDIETLKNAAVKANEDLSIDNFVLDALLNTLESRMEESEFIAFCETL